MSLAVASLTLLSQAAIAADEKPVDFKGKNYLSCIGPGEKIVIPTAKILDVGQNSAAVQELLNIEDDDGRFQVFLDKKQGRFLCILARSN